MNNILIVLLGGAVGTLSRYELSTLARNLWPTVEWPIGTFAANLLGGLLMGVLMAMLAGPLKHTVDAERVRLLIGVGFMGGFTTFSTFSLETLFMIERRHYVLAGAYAVLSVVLAVAGVAAGMWLVRRFA